MASASEREAAKKAIEAAYWESYLIGYALALQDYTRHHSDKCNDSFCYCGLKTLYEKVAEGCLEVTNATPSGSMVDQINLSAYDPTIPYHEREADEDLGR